jgi:hypothetical protein
MVGLAGTILIGYAIVSHLVDVPLIGWVVVLLLIVGIVVPGLAKVCDATPLADRFLTRGRKLAQKDPDQAFADFEQALNLAEQDKRPVFGRSVLAARAELHERQGRPGEAAADLKAIVNPNVAEISEIMCG